MCILPLINFWRLSAPSLVGDDVWVSFTPRKWRLLWYTHANAVDDDKHLTTCWLKSATALSLVESLQTRPTWSTPTRSILGDDVKHLMLTLDSLHCLLMLLPPSTMTLKHPLDHTNAGLRSWDSDEELQTSGKRLKPWGVFVTGQKACRHVPLVGDEVEDVKLFFITWQDVMSLLADVRKEDDTPTRVQGTWWCCPEHSPLFTSNFGDDPKYLLSVDAIFYLPATASTGKGNYYSLLPVLHGVSAILLCNWPPSTRLSWDIYSTVPKIAICKELDPFPLPSEISMLTTTRSRRNSELRTGVCETLDPSIYHPHPEIVSRLRNFQRIQALLKFLHV